jgi:cytoplasmic iron level regulating protein YaaA (DUF328/UPF0246 family)
MIILLSPAKTFSKSNVECQTRPIFFKDAYLIVNKLKRFSVTTLEKQMNISNNLAKEAYDNYQLFESRLFLYDLVLIRFNHNISDVFSLFSLQ